MQKNNFILYTDYYEQIQQLTVEQRGVLLTALMCYQLGDELPEMDALTKLCYSFISADVRRNNEKYDAICEKRRENGRKGGKQTQANQANARFAKANQANQANASDNDSDSDNDNDSDSGSGSDKDNVKDNGSVRADRTARTTTTTTQHNSLPVPTLEDVRAYCLENGIQTNERKFIAYNSARNWQVNGRPADWKKLLDLWVANDNEHPEPVTSKYDFDALEKALLWK